MHITQLKNFLTIIECGSINKAAQKLFMSQSTLSQQLKQLEEEIGNDLFERKGKRLQLTSEGAILAEYAQKAVVDLEKTLNQIRETKYGIKENLSVGIVQSSLIADTGRWISETAKKYPDISFQSANFTFEELLEQMENGEVDVGITKNIIRDADFLFNFEYLLIKTNKAIVVASAEIDFGDKTTLTLKDLDGKNIILRTKHEKRFLAKCAKCESYPIVKCVTRSNALKFELVRNKVGVGFFVDSIENIREIYGNNLKFYKIDGINMNSNTYVVYPKSKKNCPVLKKFLDIVYKDMTKLQV